MAGFELRGAANVDEQTAAMLILAGIFERDLAGAPEVEVESHEHEEKDYRKYWTHGFVILPPSTGRVLMMRRGLKMFGCLKAKLHLS
jgi:hypothetical protein